MNRPRYKQTTELWQLIPNDLWDRDKFRDVVGKSLENPEDFKRKVVKNPVCRQYPRDGEWLEPNSELVKLVISGNLPNELKPPFPGYTGVGKEHYFEPGLTYGAEQICKSGRLYETTMKSTHRKFPDSEYTNKTSPTNRHKSPLSKVISFHYPPSPFNDIKPKSFGTWTPMLYQKLW